MGRLSHRAIQQDKEQEAKKGAGSKESEKNALANDRPAPPRIVP
jgi:hypothetical protein